MIGAERYGWINEKHSRNPAEEYDTCRYGASVRWGPRKAGVCKTDLSK